MELFGFILCILASIVNRAPGLPQIDLSVTFTSRNLGFHNRV